MKSTKTVLRNLNSKKGACEMREKSQVEDIDRSIYDIRDEEKDAYRMKEGLTPQIVEQLSKEKGDPAWMQQFRLESLQIYNEMPVPDWGPSIEGLDMDHIATYVRPHSKMQASWKDVPEDIKETFERLGIPQAERKSLAGVGAQYDSELVYHNVKDEVAAQGVVYTDMESALKGEYADMVHKYFMKLVTPHDHKFAALHGAVWSGGSFVYVPKGVHVSIPLLSYFTQSMKYNAMMADKQHATNLAQEVLEDLKNQKELAVVTTGAGFRVPYLEGNGYTLLRETPAAAPAPAFQAENVYYAAAGTSGSTYDVEVSVSTAAAENDTNIPQIEGIDDTKDVVALEHNQLQEAMTYFSEKNMTYAAAHPGTLPLGDSELQAKMKRKFSVTADSTHVRVACSYTCGETGDEVLGIDPSEVYECNEFAEEDIRDVEHIYLMYHVAQDSDTMEVTYAAGVNPKLVFVCQNIADVNSIRPDYKMTVLPQGCPMPSVASNLGNKSYPDDPAAVTNKGAIYQDSFKLPAGSVAPLVASSGGVRKVDLTVCVYKKGKGGNNPDKEKYRYITVSTSKGE